MTERLSLTRQGNIYSQLKTPYCNGITHVILGPLDFRARLATLVPKSRVSLTRFHGIFAPNSSRRAKVIAGIEDPGVIERILHHLDRRARHSPAVIELPLARAPSQRKLPGFEE